MTNKDYFNMVLEANLSEEVNAWAEKNIKALEDKAEKAKTRERKPSKETVKRQGIIATAIDEMERGTPLTIEQLLATVPSFAELTKGQVSSIMSEYVKDGKATRTLEKKKVAYIIL